jgi:predicted GNAT superfamily acetyltransferase
MEGINSGTPSDRLLADWHLDAPGVRACRDGQAPVAPGDVVRRIAIPEDFEALMVSDPAAALGWRLTLRDQMTGALAEGLVIRGFDAAARCYLLVHPAP